MASFPRLGLAIDNVRKLATLLHTSPLASEALYAVQKKEKNEDEKIGWFFVYWNLEFFIIINF